MIQRGSERERQRDGVNGMREIDKKKGRGEGRERGGDRMREKREKEGRHLFHITAFNLTQVVKLADNTDSFAKASHEE